ncbi:MAG: type II secretion system protein GspM [Sedimentisphaerales bacterium]|jgi:type II secretory pathway component PulM
MMRLTRREYGLTVGGVVLTLGWAIYALGLAPVRERIDTLERVIPQKRTELDQLRVKAREYTRLHEDIGHLRARIDSQDKAFELLPFMEALVAQCGLTQNVTTMNPVPTQSDTDVREVVLDVEMENVTLRQLCGFVEKIQAPNTLVSIERLTIKKNPTDPNQVDSSIELRTFKPAPIRGN